MNVHELTAPFTADAVAPLRVGTRVRVSGTLLTARCLVQQLLLNGGESPVKLEHAAIYFCSPIIVRDGAQWIVRAAGPSTSVLVGSYVPDFIARYRVRVLLGVGDLGEPTRRACMRYGCVYLQTVGGAAGKIASSIRHVNGVHYLKEFGAADAMWSLQAEQLEAVVAIDTHGRSLHRRVCASSRRALKAML
ncbi:MAG: fumarate hydratase C-terminal domain-containing protein [Verrucomicrobia bacterium]|nr:fumarate hydratase C-terminal domain-containing protein [Verrucomicrobiota bacterium]